MGCTGAKLCALAHSPDRPALTLRFGDQVDPRPIWRADNLPGTGQRLDVKAVGNYIAKYATKALDAPGVPDRPLRTRAAIDALPCSRHHKQMITTAWQLGGGRHFPARTRLCQMAHQFGWGGPLSDQVPPLLHHLRRPAPRAHRTPQTPAPPPRRTRPMGPSPR